MIVPHFSTAQKQEPEQLQKLIKLQRESGGRLIAYSRFWSMIFLTVAQPRIVWVRQGGSRFLAGLPHSIFTLLLGIWAIPGIFLVPVVIIRNSMGGIDVTEFYSTSSIDLMRESPPSPGTAAREERRSQRILVTLLCLMLAACVIFIVRTLS